MLKVGKTLHKPTEDLSINPIIEDDLLISIIKLIETRRETTNLPDYLFQCKCFHDKFYHLTNKCKFKGCKCLFYKQKSIKVGGFAPFIIKSNKIKPNIVIRNLKSKEFWKQVELNLIEKGESSIMK